MLTLADLASDAARSLCRQARTGDRDALDALNALLPVANGVELAAIASEIPPEVRDGQHLMVAFEDDNMLFDVSAVWVARARELRAATRRD